MLNRLCFLIIFSYLVAPEMLQIYFETASLLIFLKALVQSQKDFLKAADTHICGFP